MDSPFSVNNAKAALEVIEIYRNYILKFPFTSLIIILISGSAYTGSLFIKREKPELKITIQPIETYKFEEENVLIQKIRTVSKDLPLFNVTVSVRLQKLMKIDN